MRILFCVQASALHAARWINQFAGEKMELHVIENIVPGWGVCPEFKCGYFHVPYPLDLPAGLSGTSTLRASWLARIGLRLGRKPGLKLMQRAHEDYFLELLNTLKPDVIHVLGLGVNWINQSATLMRVRERLGGRLPGKVVFSSWGTDFELFGLNPANRDVVKSFLEAVDYLVVECDRDLRLAKELGFKGEFAGKLPAFGGTDVGEVIGYRLLGKSSERKLLLVKGRDHANGGDPVGRAMTIMRALAICAEDVKKAGCRVAVFQADRTVTAEVHVLRATTGLNIELLPRLSYEGLMRLMGSARAVVATTINDGLPSILVESMAFGALPIHSNLEPVREWIEDGRNGLLVPPEDAQLVANALCRVVRDDDLVDQAAGINEAAVRQNLNWEGVKSRALEIYSTAAGAGHS